MESDDLRLLTRHGRQIRIQLKSGRVYRFPAVMVSQHGDALIVMDGAGHGQPWMIASSAIESVSEADGRLPLDGELTGLAPAAGAGFRPNSRTVRPRLPLP